MAVTVNPSAFGPKPQFVDWITGAIANGYQVFFYLAGSVGTKQDTYTDSTGTVKNTNPLVLDTAGQPNNVQIWWPQGNSYKVLIATPTDTDPPTNGFLLGDNLRGINDSGSSPVTGEWITGPAPSFISGTQFSMTGDQTSNFQVNRRVQTKNSGGTVYGTITASSLVANITTVTVVNDSGSLDAGLSAVFYGILSATNQSLPPFSGNIFAIQDNTDNTKRVKVSASGVPAGTTSTLNVAAAQVVEGTQGATIPSAATTNLDTATGDYDHISGTVAITAITLSQGRQRTVVFDGILTLTNGASLILPGGANITTAAGDTAVFRGEAAGVVRCVSYSAAAKGPFPVDVQIFTANGTWTKLSGARTVTAICVGAGGGGAGGQSASGFPGSGGGGGATVIGFFNAADLSATETITVGTGGTAGPVGAAGGAGGSSSFGARLVSFGGGQGTVSGVNNSGGGGGGTGGVGGSGGTSNSIGGAPTTAANTAGIGGGGGGSGTISNGQPAEYGGGGGGGIGAGPGGSSLFGAGGGGGGGITTPGAGQAGGKAGVWIAAGGGGGTGGTSPGGAGGTGTNGSGLIMGSGGGGGGGTAAGTAGSGGAGGAPGGGGGAGGAGPTGGAGGAGARGEVRVYTYF